MAKPITFFENKKMHYLGKISYGIYMLHAIMMQLMGFVYLKFLISLNLPNYLLILISNILIVGLTILVAHFSYKYYESYFLNVKVKFQNKGI